MGLGHPLGYRNPTVGMLLKKTHSLSLSNSQLPMALFDQNTLLDIGGKLPLLKEGTTYLRLKAWRKQARTDLEASSLLAAFTVLEVSMRATGEEH